MLKNVTLQNIDSRSTDFCVFLFFFPNTSRWQSWSPVFQCFCWEVNSLSCRLIIVKPCPILSRFYLQLLFLFFFLAVYDVSCGDLFSIYSAWILLSFLNLLVYIFQQILGKLSLWSLQILSSFFSFWCSHYTYTRLFHIVPWVTEP